MAQFIKRVLIAEAFELEGELPPGNVNIGGFHNPIVEGFKIEHGSNEVYLSDYCSPEYAAAYAAENEGYSILSEAESVWQIGDILVFHNGENENSPTISPNGIPDLSAPSYDQAERANPSFTFSGKIVAIERNPTYPVDSENRLRYHSKITLDRTYIDPDYAKDAVEGDTEEGGAPAFTPFAAIYGGFFAFASEDHVDETRDADFNTAFRFNQVAHGINDTIGHIALIRGASSNLSGDNREVWEIETFLDKQEEARARGIRSPGVHSVKTVRKANGSVRVYNECIESNKFKNIGTSESFDLQDFYIIDLATSFQHEIEENPI